MENWVAVEVTTEQRKRYFFMTWGRIQDAVDPAPLEALVIQAAEHFSLDGRPVKARVCLSLKEASQQPYFFEALLTFAQERIPFGEHYDEWRQRKHRAMSEGREFYFLGRRPR
jgi:hypothetical protein